MHTGEDLITFVIAAALFGLALFGAAGYLVTSLK